ncbi:hypothetical protein KSP40_PGU016037 [Platanthera guangdongensis]|uniref:Uncharacterized protein n=1 Tax=Platanthera guangdongensis TaxID=2320717 RepID=A0ABR2LGQ6_9ASPA
MRAQARLPASTVLCSFSSSNSDNKQYLCLVGVKTLIHVNLLRSTNSARPLPPFIHDQGQLFFFWNPFKYDLYSM